MKVMKFGGTSVGSANSILSLKNIVEEAGVPIMYGDMILVRGFISLHTNLFTNWVILLTIYRSGTRHLNRWG